MSVTDPHALRLCEPFVPTNGRIRLRELVHDDDAFIMELVNDPLWLRFVGDRKVHSLPAARGYIDRVRDTGYARQGFGLWAVELVASGVTTGICGLLKRDTLDLPDVGFAFLERHRGQGLAAEAMRATLGLARRRYALARVCAITTTDNAASQAVLLRAGFVFARTQRDDDDGVVLNVYECTLAGPDTPDPGSGIGKEVAP